MIKNLRNVVSKVSDSLNFDSIQYLIFWKSLLFFSGIYGKGDRHNLELFMSAVGGFSFLAVIFGSSIGYSNIEGLFEKINGLLSVVIYLTSSSHFIALNYHKESIRKLYSFVNHPSPLFIEENGNQEFRKIFRSYFVKVWLVHTAFIWLTMSAFSTVLKNEEIDFKNPCHYVLPFVLYCGENEESRFCWYPRNYFQYLIFNGIQFVSIFLCSAIPYSFLALSLVIYAYFQSHLKVIKRHLKKLSVTPEEYLQKVIESTESYDQFSRREKILFAEDVIKRYNGVMNAKMIEIIKYYQNVHQ